MRPLSKGAARNWTRNIVSTRKKVIGGQTSDPILVLKANARRLGFEHLPLFIKVKVDMLDW